MYQLAHILLTDLRGRDLLLPAGEVRSVREEAGGTFESVVTMAGGTEHEVSQTVSAINTAINALWDEYIASNQDPIRYYQSVYAAGSAYSLTNSAAALNFGTTDPSITIGQTGTYRIQASTKLTYTGATVVAETATVKLRRTNNTAADLTNGSVTIDLPAATTLTHDWGVTVLDVIYTTTNTDDAVALFGQVSATLGAGTIDATAAHMIAHRIA